MILYKNVGDEAVDRPNKTIKMEIEEMPERPIYIFKNNKDRVKFIKMCESIIRKSDEYKGYIKFIKTHLDMNKCTILKKLSSGNGKRYSIEIHHEPFTLFDICDIVLTKFEELSQPINPFLISDEVMLLHYDEKIGLVPLSKTIHELVGNDKIFLPLQYIYQDYGVFYDEYEEFIPDNVKQKIEMKVNLSLKCGDVISDVLDPEYVYIEVDGFKFPEIPEEWGKIMNSLSLE